MEKNLNAHIDKLTSKDGNIDKLTSEFLKLKQQIELLSTELKVVKDSTELIKISKDKTEIKNKLYANNELVSVPIGTIVAFYGTSIPDGWALCDGSYNSDLGQYVPDLRNKFIRGSANLKLDKNTYGEDEVKLKVENLPDHNHLYYESWFNATTKYGTIGADNKDKLYDGHSYDFKARLTTSGHTVNGNSSSMISKPFSIVPKHISLTYIIKVK